MTTENTPDPPAPDTIVLIHGLWVTPRSWEKWAERYEGKGYRVLAPAYPGFEVEVEELMKALGMGGISKSLMSRSCARSWIRRSSVSEAGRWKAPTLTSG